MESREEEGNLRDARRKTLDIYATVEIFSLFSQIKHDNSSTKRRDEWFALLNKCIRFIVINEKYPLSYSLYCRYRLRSFDIIEIYIYIHSPHLSWIGAWTEIDSIATGKPHFYWQSRMIWPHFVHFIPQMPLIFSRPHGKSHRLETFSFQPIVIKEHYYHVQIFALRNKQQHQVLNRELIISIRNCRVTFLKINAMTFLTSNFANQFSNLFQYFRCWFNILRVIYKSSISSTNGNNNSYLIHRCLIKRRD